MVSAITHVQKLNFKGNIQHNMTSVSNVPNMTNVNFQASQSSIFEKTQKNDTLEITNQKEKEGLSTGAKWAIGLGTVAALGLAVRFGYPKYLKHLYNKKLIQLNLPEKLNFDKAKSLEEAIKYSKDTLKIKNLDSNLTLEQLNFINKALTDVSNAHKGKVILPKSIKLSDFGNMSELGEVFGGVNISIFSKDFLTLELSQKMFNTKYLDKQLKKCFLDKKGLPKYNGDIYKNGDVFYRINGDLKSLMNKFYKNPELLSMEEKQSLLTSYYKHMENIAYKTNLKKAGDKYFVTHMQLRNPYEELYHEMGHCQDLTRIMKEDLAHPFQFKTAFNTITKSQAKDVKATTKENLVFINDKSIQETASKVSQYAKENINEFIAETYAGLLSGRTFSDDVIALYKKYGGPVIKR